MLINGEVLDAAVLNNCRVVRLSRVVFTEGAALEVEPTLLNIFFIEDADEVENKGMPISATKAMNAEMRMKELNFDRWEPLSCVFMEFLLRLVRSLVCAVRGVEGQPDHQTRAETIEAGKPAISVG
jgi:hypothetical protein